jgi:membrane-associated protease RseP (regulator of RpoE activity)
MEENNWKTVNPSLSFSRPRRRRFPAGWLFSGKPSVNLILFILTVLSTWVTAGFWYSISIVSILFVHEMGHYLMCRRYGVSATLPYFIPFPLLNPFGTMGAVIRMKGIIPDRKALFDIGAAGPIAGFLLSLPVVAIGIYFSTVIQTGENSAFSIQLGEPLLFKFISNLIVGPLDDSQDILLHPVAYAGWAGLFVTSLNLLPIGQLDGGHVLYSLFGKKSRLYYLVFLGFLGMLSLIYPGWILLFILLVFLGRKHPPPWNDFTPLDKKRQLLAFLVFIIFLISFTPTPFIL